MPDVLERHRYIQTELQIYVLIILKIACVEYNKVTSKERNVEVKESEDTEVPDRLKPFYMKAKQYLQLWKVDLLT